METKHPSNHINDMYPELNELENVGGDFLNKLDLFFINTNLDENQRKMIVSMLNEAYTTGLVDGLSTD